MTSLGELPETTQGAEGGVVQDAPDLQPAASTPGFYLPPALAGGAICLVLLLLDRLPRFYQGDSTAYLSTGLNGWIPPDRSWFYGFGSRWLVEGTGAAGSLPLMQASMLLGAVILACRVFRGQPAGQAGAVGFAVVAMLDPLNEAYSRFWLSDTAGAAAFIAFATLLAAVAGGTPRTLRLLLVPLAAAAFFSVFVRVAYAPVEVGTVLLAVAAASWTPRSLRVPGLRRRLLACALLPVLAAGSLAVANSRVALPRLQGQVFLNRMSDLYTLGVFLPGLRRDDLERAGIAMSQDEFDRLETGRYDLREHHMWVDGPQYLRFLMQQRLGIEDVYDARFQRAAAAAVRSAVLHHPQSLAVVYVRSLLLYFSPGEWAAPFRGEMGYDRPLPEWAANYLSWKTGRPVAADVTAQPSLLPGALGVVIGGYPVLLLAGCALAAAVLLRRQPFGARHVVAAALLSSVLMTPLFSHIVKPRYVLASVTLSELLIVLASCTVLHTALLRQGWQPRRNA